MKIKLLTLTALLFTHNFCCSMENEIYPDDDEPTTEQAQACFNNIKQETPLIIIELAIIAGKFSEEPSILLIKRAGNFEWFIPNTFMQGFGLDNNVKQLAAEIGIETNYLRRLYLHDGICGRLTKTGCVEVPFVAIGISAEDYSGTPQSNKGDRLQFFTQSELSKSKMETKPSKDRLYVILDKYKKQD